MVALRSRVVVDEPAEQVMPEDRRTGPADLAWVGGSGYRSSRLARPSGDKPPPCRARRLGVDIDYDAEIKPYLDQVPNYTLAEVTGVSKAHCDKIRRGISRPQPSHWRAVLELVRAVQAKKE